jgi:hypothetical protein
MNKSPSSSCNQSYRSVIALNNIGVSLLERRCYQQAAETLKDALSLIKAVSTTQNRHSLQETVHTARQRLANPQAVRHEVVHVEVLTNTVSAKAMRAILEETSCNDSKASAIRIEDFDCGTTSEFISAILLHNFGLSYYCISKAAKKGSSNEQKYLNGAVRLLRISHSVFAKAIDENSESSFHFLHVMVVVLSTLITTLHQNKREAEARPFCSMLDHLRFTIAESQGMICFVNGAAAAA